VSFRDEQGNIFYACSEGFTKTKMRLKTLEVIRKEGKFNSCLFRLYPSFYNSEYMKAKKKYEVRKE
jgi:hypothetical protein